MNNKFKSTLAAMTVALGCAFITAPASAFDCDSYLNDSKLAAAMHDITGLTIFREIAFTSWQSYQTCLRAQR